MWSKIFFFKFVISFTGIFCSWNQILAQKLQVGLPFFEERIRLKQIDGSWDTSVSFLIRPLDLGDLSSNWNYILENDSIYDLRKYQKEIRKKQKFETGLLPISLISGFTSGNPYPTTSNLLISKGGQIYFSGGVYLRAGFLRIQFQPEFIYSENLEYEIGQPKSWNIEFVERFGTGSYKRVFPGQSSIKVDFGAFSAGFSTENLWWGPGQFNSLLFSNNAFGFPHFTINTRRPAKTFIGKIEAQVLAGRLEGADIPNSPIENIIDERRYLNGFSISIQPRWVPNLFLGVSRVFQQYESFRGNSFSDYFPIFDPFQKKDVFVNGNDSGAFDQEGRDQQVTFHGRYLIPKALMEFYFEYGRRDHAFNWREATLNPEHARAFLLGLNKKISLANKDYLLFKAEIIQQQESINIIVRYPGIGGSLNWSGHGVVRHGFTNFGQMMGPGIGPGSNAQTFEISWLKPQLKFGLLMERVNRYQDFYTANFNDPSPANRWVDFSTSILGDLNINKFVLTSRLNFINSANQGWLPISGSGIDFSKGKSRFVFQSQIGLVFFPGKNSN